jgi:periplasmic protein TonB
MKKLILIIPVILYFSFNGFSQTADSSGDKSSNSVNTHVISAGDTNHYVTVEIEAEFPGGPSAWVEYLGNNINSKVPRKHKAPVGQYQVRIEFVVSKDGSITNIKPLTNCGYGMEDEAIRVIANSPKWKPAMQNGKYVGAYRIQPIIFQVEK